MHIYLIYDTWSKKLNLWLLLFKHIIIILNTPSAPIIQLEHPSFPPVLLMYRNHQQASLTKLYLYYLICPVYNLNNIPFLSHLPFKCYHESSTICDSWVWHIFYSQKVNVSIRNNNTISYILIPKQKSKNRSTKSS